jgi:ribosomal protein S18 acetylase RimI-like enzyme
MTGARVLARVKAEIEVVIRPCEEEDLPALEWMGLYSPHRQIIREAFEAQKRGDALLLLAVSAGFPVAQVFIDLARKREAGVALLWAVRTFYPLQGAGIGRQLMATAESILRNRGIKRAELGVERDNKQAIKFYVQQGWQAAGPLTENVEFSDTDGTLTTVKLEQWLLTKDL